MKSLFSRRVFIGLFTLFLISTGIILWIIYQDSKQPLSIIFVVGYTIFVLLFLSYAIILAAGVLKKLSWLDLRKRFYRFIIAFVVLVLLSLVSNSIFKSEPTYSNSLLTVFGVALGIAFLDVAFSGNENDE